MTAQKGEETTDPNADNADEPSAKAEVSSGIDERGLGKETFLGRDAALDKDGNVVTGSGSVMARKKGLLDHRNLARAMED